jgi:hypothetical protein
MLKCETDTNLPLRQICAAMRWQRSRRLGVPRTVVYLNAVAASSGLGRKKAVCRGWQAGL